MKPVVVVNGRPISLEHLPQADIVEVEPGLYSVILNGRSYDVRLNGATVAVNGRECRVELQDPRRWDAGSHGPRAGGRETLRSPMPGKIVRVLVAAGAEVAAGQGIVIMEAMKMQNELKAPRAGRVSSIAVRDGDAVEAGAVLATID